MDEPELLTVENAARALQISRSTLYSWIAEGLVPIFRLHGVTRIPRSVLIALIEQRVSLPASISGDAAVTTRDGHRHRGRQRVTPE